MRADELLLEPGEQVLGILGETADTETGELGNHGAMVLSDHRLYQAGKCLYRTTSGSWKPIRGMRSVALEDVMSVGVTEERNTGLLASGVFLMCFCLINIQGLQSGEDFLTFLSLMGLILVLSSGIACIVMAFARQKRMFIAEYPGGSMGLVASKLDHGTLKNFKSKLVATQCD